MRVGVASGFSRKAVAVVESLESPHAAFRLKAEVTHDEGGVASGFSRKAVAVVESLGSPHAAFRLKAEATHDEGGVASGFSRKAVAVVESLGSPHAAFRLKAEATHDEGDVASGFSRKAVAVVESLHHPKDGPGGEVLTGLAGEVQRDLAIRRRLGLQPAAGQQAERRLQPVGLREFLLVVANPGEDFVPAARQHYRESR